MPSRARLREARRAVRKFLATFPPAKPGDTRTLYTANSGQLDVAHLEVLLRAEKQHRATLRSQRVKLEERDKEIRQLHYKLASARTENERLLRSGGAVARGLRALLANAEQERDRAQAALSNFREEPVRREQDPTVQALRKLVEERGRKIRELTADRDREKRSATTYATRATEFARERDAALQDVALLSRAADTLRKIREALDA